MRSFEHNLTTDQHHRETLPTRPRVPWATFRTPEAVGRPSRRLTAARAVSPDRIAAPNSAPNCRAAATSAGFTASP
jgi:hypothetical protein